MREVVAALDAFGVGLAARRSIPVDPVALEPIVRAGRVHRRDGTAL